MPAVLAGYFLQKSTKKSGTILLRIRHIYFFYLFSSFFTQGGFCFFAVASIFVAANADKNIPKHPERMLREKIGAVFLQISADFLQHIAETDIILIMPDSFCRFLFVDLYLA